MTMKWDRLPTIDVYKRQAHMFEPFTRNTERVEGTGLGLSITRGLVKLMDGTISVESRIHEGTTSVSYTHLDVYKRQV